MHSDVLMDCSSTCQQDDDSSEDDEVSSSSDNDNGTKKAKKQSKKNLSLMHFTPLQSGLYRVYQKKLNKFEIAPNFAKRIEE